MSVSITGKVHVNLYSNDILLKTKSGVNISSESLSEAVKENYTASIFDKIKAFFLGSEQLRAKQAVHDLIWAKDLATALKAFTELKNMSGDGTKGNFSGVENYGTKELELKIRAPEILSNAILHYTLQFEDDKDLSQAKAYVDNGLISEEHLTAMKDYKLGSNVTINDYLKNKPCALFQFFSNVINYGRPSEVHDLGRNFPGF